MINFIYDREGLYHELDAGVVVISPGFGSDGWLMIRVKEKFHEDVGVGPYFETHMLHLMDEE